MLGAWHVYSPTGRMCCQSRIWISKGLEALASWGQGARETTTTLVDDARAVLRKHEFGSKVYTLFPVPYQVSTVGIRNLISQKLEIRAQRGTVVETCSGPFGHRPPALLLGSSGELLEWYPHLGTSHTVQRTPQCDKPHFDLIRFKDIFLSILFTI